MRKESLLELIRLAYLSGISDKEEDVDRWCEVGSGERALEIFEENYNNLIQNEYMFEECYGNTYAEALTKLVKQKDIINKSRTVEWEGHYITYGSISSGHRVREYYIEVKS